MAEAREEDTPSAGLDPCLGRRIRRRSGCRKTWAEGGGYGARLSDRLNMRDAPGFSNGATNMTAMRLAQASETFWIKLGQSCVQAGESVFRLIGRERS